MNDEWADIDHALFWGTSYNDEQLLDRHGKSERPRYPFAEVPTSQHLEFSEPIQRFPLTDIMMELPQWNRPNYWSKPLDIKFTNTIDFYKTFTMMGVYNIPKNKMVTLTGMSYEFDDQLGLFDVFSVEVFETGKLITRFQDMRVKTAAAEPNPAHQFAFGTHLFPIPVNYSIDQSFTLTVRVSILGIAPFPNTVVTPYNGDCSVLLHAYESQLADRRDGAPRLKAQNTTLDHNEAIKDTAKALAELKQLYPDYDPNKVGT